MKQTAVAIIDTELPVRTDIHPIMTFIPELDKVTGISRHKRHGFHCYSVIRERASSTNFYSFPVLNENGLGISEHLIYALESVRETDATIINLSLSVKTDSVALVEKLRTICNKLYCEGRIIVNAFDNEGGICFPALFDCVLGVQGLPLFSPESYWFNADKEIQCVASGAPCLVRADNGDFEMFDGNSKATAIVSGMLANLLESGLNADRVVNHFHQYATVRNHTDADITNFNAAKQRFCDEREPNLQSLDYVKLCNLLNGYVEDDDRLPLVNGAFLPHLGVGFELMPSILKQIWTVFGFRAEEACFEMRDCITAWALYNKLRRCGLICSK